jgi:DinB family protein
MSGARMDSVTLAALADFPHRLEAYYGIVSAEHRNWRPPSWEGIPSEPFTPIEQICHVKDIEIDGYHVRFRRALQENHPLLASLDGERLAEDRNYAAADSARVFNEFAQARRETLALIAHLSPQELSRPAEFEGNAVTVRGLAHNLCSHDQQHLAGLQWLLARLAAPALGG